MEATKNLLIREEADQIRKQFRGLSLRPGCQVMWSGVPRREWAQLWADRNNKQTLTTAMGPLMNTKHPSCLKSRKSAKAWKRYVQGASSLFADCLPKGDVVTILSRPPPQRLNPKGISTYQILEEPILKGIYGGIPVSRIDMVHVGVEGAENYRYQVWPKDQQQLWVEKYGLNKSRKHFKPDKKVDVSPKMVDVQVGIRIHPPGAEPNSAFSQTSEDPTIFQQTSFECAGENTCPAAVKEKDNGSTKAKKQEAKMEKIFGKGQGQKRKEKKKKEGEGEGEKER